MDTSTETNACKKRSKRSVLMKKNKEVIQFEPWIFKFESVKPVKNIPADKQTPAVCWTAIEGRYGIYNIFGLANPTNAMLDYIAAKRRSYIDDVEDMDDLYYAWENLKSVDDLNNDTILKDIAYYAEERMIMYAKQSILEKIKDVECFEAYNDNEQLSIIDSSSCKVDITKNEAAEIVFNLINNHDYKWEELFTIFNSLTEEDKLEIVNSSEFLDFIQPRYLGTLKKDYKNGDDLVREFCSWFSFESLKTLLQKRNGFLFLAYLPESEMSYRLCLFYADDRNIKEKHHLYINQPLKHVPDIYFTEELCEIAVRTNPKSIKYIANPTERMCQDAVERDPEAIKYIENPSEATCIQAVSNNGEMIKYITNLTNKICKAALEAEQGKKYIIINYINDTFKNV